LITGAAVRIGRAIAKSFAAAGANLLIHCNRSRSAAEELLAELGGEKAGHSVLCADLRELSSLPGLMARAGTVDILVNNASVFGRRPLAAESLAEAQEEFAVNFWAPLELMKLFYAQGNLREGCIINILDQRISSSDPLFGAYALSKKSLAEATLAAALQWASRIRVNGIALGPVMPPVGMEDSAMEKTLKTVPMKMAVPLGELCEACLFLSRSESITGELLFLDGGQHLFRQN